MEAPELEAPRSLPPATLDEDLAALRQLVAVPGADRLFYVVDAMRAGMSEKELHERTRIDPWYLAQFRRIVAAEQRIAAGEVGPNQLREYKRLGFSDRQLGALMGKNEDEVRALRKQHGIVPVYGRVDTCAAEFVAKTPYMYSTYESESESRPTERRKVVILGGGPNRIG
jgi:carbamoyl-phosphate synthase large subunit